MLTAVGMGALVSLNLCIRVLYQAWLSAQELATQDLYWRRRFAEAASGLLDQPCSPAPASKSRICAWYLTECPDPLSAFIMQIPAGSCGALIKGQRQQRWRPAAAALPAPRLPKGMASTAPSAAAVATGAPQPGGCKCPSPFWNCRPPCSPVDVPSPAAESATSSSSAAAAADVPGHSVGTDVSGSQASSRDGSRSGDGGTAAGYGGATPLFPSQRYKLPPECAKHTVLYGGIYADLAGVLSARPGGITEAGELPRGWTGRARSRSCTLSQQQRERYRGTWQW